MNANTAYECALRSDPKDLSYYLKETEENISVASKYGRMDFTFLCIKRKLSDEDRLSFINYFRDLGYKVTIKCDEFILISWDKKIFKKDEGVYYMYGNHIIVLTLICTGKFYLID